MQKQKISNKAVLDRQENDNDVLLCIRNYLCILCSVSPPKSTPEMVDGFYRFQLIMHKHTKISRIRTSALDRGSSFRVHTWCIHS